MNMWKYYDMKNWSESCKEKTTMARYDLKHRQKCNECLNVHRFLGLLFETAIEGFCFSMMTLSENATHGVVLHCQLRTTLTISLQTIMGGSESKGIKVVPVLREVDAEHIASTSGMSKDEVFLNF